MERRAPLYGLHGSHLLKYETTRLGDAMVIDVKGTGRRASSLVHGSLAEDIAEVEMLAVSRVQVTLAGIAGRIRISIRRKDPWKNPIPHPALDPAGAEYALPPVCTVREPLIVGVDPETGKPLQVAVWDRHGGKNILLTGIKGAGKSVLLSCIRERLTAADDALIFDINVSKALEDGEWAPACGLVAAGRDQRKRALHILRCAHRAIDYRGSQPRDTAVFQPSPEAPLIVVMIDEIDALTAGGDFIAAAIKAELAYITSKDRSEAVTAIISGQRATADWLGGANIRSQVDVFAIGKVGRRGEMNHAAGDEVGLSLPDMATYGEGHPGVWVIAELGGSHAVGRTFNLEAPPDLRRLAAERAASQPELEPGLIACLGATYAALRNRAPAMAGGPPDGSPADAPPPDAPAVDPIDALDGEMEDMLPPELRDKLRRMDLRRKETTALNAESDAIMAALPEVDAAALAAHTAARWDAAGEETEIPPDVREKLIMLLAGDGMSGRKITEAFPGVKRWQVMLWLNRLRFEGNARIEGKGRGARWMIISRPAEGDSQ